MATLLILTRVIEFQHLKLESSKKLNRVAYKADLFSFKLGSLLTKVGRPLYTILSTEIREVCAPTLPTKRSGSAGKLFSREAMILQDQ